MSRILFLGLGYCARVVAEGLHAAGWDIVGTARSAETAKALDTRGWRGVVFDGATPSAELARELRTATHVLDSVPPGAEGDPCLIHHAKDFATAPALEAICYFSTVGVYGGADGGSVDETTVCAPVSERGQRRLAAERSWQEVGAQSGKRVSILRLPGIYGQGRSAFDALRAGTARRIVKPGQVFNRVHVEDIARVTIEVLGKRQPSSIYNVTDDEPGPPQDVVAYAAQLLGLPPPREVPFETADLSPMARGFYGESKRVSNARLKAELGLELLYPSYREGLAAILDAERIASP